MKEKLETVAGELKLMNLATLIKRLIAHQYAFATWRLPESEESYFIIDLQLGKEQVSIEDTNDCFVINPFIESHPPKPVSLKGDIVIIISSETKHLELSPKLSSEQLDHFSNVIQTDLPQDAQANETEGKANLSFVDKVQKTIDFIKNGNASKIVLSRFEDIRLKNGFDLFTCFEELKDNYPSAFCYLTHTPEMGTWMGASPERLMSIENNRIFKTESLAGTQYLPDIESLGDVAWTQKEIEEQAMVSRYIINCLKKIRLREFKESGPKTVRAGKLVHLKTAYEVDMVETNMPDLGSIMIELLHPTSAVCGEPREIASQFIEENEGYDRALYAGFLGPVNFKDKTALFVNLRCMQLFKNKARLYAGAGITAGSNPQKEYQETINKMKTLKDIL